MRSLQTVMQAPCCVYYGNSNVAIIYRQKRYFQRNVAEQFAMWENRRTFASSIRTNSVSETTATKN